MKTEFRSGLLNHGNDGPINGVQRRSSSGFSPHFTVVITSYSVLARLKLTYRLPQRKIVEAIREGGVGELSPWRGEDCRNASKNQRSRRPDGDKQA